MEQQERIQKEKGLVHLGLIIAAVSVMAALAFAGWWVWNKNRQENTKQSSNNTQTNNNSESKQNDPSEGGKYLVITEWGVRFLLPEELRGDVYYQVRENEITKLQRASFASNKLDSLLGDFSCSFKENPAIDGISAALLRLSPKNQSAPNYISDHLDLLKNLGDYEYFTTRQNIHPITCLTNQHEEFNDVEQSISNQLHEAFTKLEAIN